MKINVLGTIYTIEYKTLKQDPKLSRCDGYFDHSTKRIVCFKYSEEDRTEMSVENFKVLENRALRHEIIHAFLYESGLSEDSFDSRGWATNEEMVDWIAIQSPKIYDVYKKLNILE